ncbi:hypothetical protein C8A00DRAFT_19497 [Chaetomidium leptoderma]|uniref:CCHC-type domain-containing protein n=1 Tax=Chaetomidium leptoderma TaxID=669021 RepID=A0AAN6VCE4_9PEZI|nr:hypothetical protein C8A00DRAFT_19497 [Chaetomidium leptoderma]
MAPSPSRVSREGTPSPTTENRARLHSSETSNNTINTPSRVTIESQPVQPEPERPIDPEARLQATQDRIAKLEEVERLEAQERELLAKLGLNKTDLQPKRKRRDSSSSASSAHHTKAIKVKNITQFTDSMTYRKRSEWLRDLERAFAGDPKRYKTSKNKILFAVDNMSTLQRNHWYSHCASMSKTDREEAETDWDIFEKWTTTCVKDVADQVSTAAKRLNEAKQRENQSPVDFHMYLESLEDQFPRADEKTRALSFYTKLTPELISHLDMFVHPKPEQREDMVKEAMQAWTSMKKSKMQGTSSSRGGRGSRTGRQGRGHYPSWGRGGKTQTDDTKTTDQHDDTTTKDSRKEGETTNPNGLRCYVCDSDQHLANHCPKRPSQVNQVGRYRRRGYRGAKRGQAKVEETTAEDTQKTSGND